MKQISGKELARIVHRKGWSLARVHGSHHIFIMGATKGWSFRCMVIDR